MLARLTRNSIWLVLSRGGAQLAQAAFTVLAARALGSAGFGEYAFMAAVVYSGNVLTTFGTDMLLIREIAARRDYGALSSALLLQLLLSAAFVGLVAASAPVLQFQDRSAPAALLVFSLSLFALAYFTVCTTALRGSQHMLAYSLLSLASSGLQAVAAAWLFLQRGSLLELAMLLLAAQVLSAGLAAAVCRRLLPRSARLHPSGLRMLAPLLRASAPIALLSLLGMIYQRVLYLLLPALAGSSAAGWYAAAARVVEAAKLGHFAALTAIYPMMAQGHQDGAGFKWRAFRAPMLLMLGGGAAISISLYALAGPTIGLLLGRSYAHAVPALQILAWILLPYSASSFLTLALLAQRETTAILRGLGLAALALVALSAWWIPRSGISGAAWAALLAETLQAGMLAVPVISRSIRLRRAGGDEAAGRTRGRDGVRDGAA